MSKLLDYLNILDKDAIALEAHKSSAKSAMTSFGLTEAEQAAVMTGNKDIVAQLLGVSAQVVPAIDATETAY